MCRYRGLERSRCRAAASQRLACADANIRIGVVAIRVDLKNERVTAIAARCDGMIATQDEAVP
jgi:hypothetical protein